MASGDSRRRLVVNADDFGRSPSINRAVVLAHREGILTTASLMVNGAAANEAVELARQNPQLGVGLHLTLVCGTAALPTQEIPGLANGRGEFSDNAVASGMRYFFQSSLAAQLRREIAAQFEKFHKTGLVLDHVNGHLNLHLHPVVFRILLEQAKQSGVRHIRLTREPFWLNVRLDRGRWFYRVSHAVIFQTLSRWAQPQLERRNIRHTHTVFGLLQTGHLSEAYVAQLLPQLPKGDSELYSHPCLETARNEVDALTSPKVRRLLQENSIHLIRYQDL